MSQKGEPHKQPNSICDKSKGQKSQFVFSNFKRSASQFTASRKTQVWFFSVSSVNSWGEEVGLSRECGAEGGREVKAALSEPPKSFDSSVQAPPHLPNNIFHKDYGTHANTLDLDG